VWEKRRRSKRERFSFHNKRVEAINIVREERRSIELIEFGGRSVVRRSDNKVDFVRECSRECRGRSERGETILEDFKG
jgi:hypothetical protein